MDIGRLVPLVDERIGDRHAAISQELEPHMPNAEIGERDDGAPADPRQFGKHAARVVSRLQGLRQNDVVEGVGGDSPSSRCRRRLGSPTSPA